MARAFEWKNRDQLISDMSECWDQMQRDRKPNGKKWDEIVRESVGANTYRGLRGRPSQIFRSWALQQQGTFSRLANVRSQLHFDYGLFRLADDLKQSWPGKPKLSVGARFKLLNLLAKMHCESLSPEKWSQLIAFLHVPMDKCVLTAIRGIVRDTRIGQIPGKPTMSFVGTEEQYCALQEAFRQLGAEARCPANRESETNWPRSKP